MAQEWKSYICTVNDKLVSIALDLGFSSETPKPDKPWLLWVWVYMKSPRPDGLSQRSELESLGAIEDELAKGFGGSHGAVEAGRITTDGRREFYFYGQHAKDFKQSVREVMGRFKNYKYDFGTQEDAGWNQYLNVLYPSDEDMQRIQNRDVLAVLEQNGDTLTPVRDVHHWIYFRSRESRESFTSEAQELGYKIEDQTERSGEERPFGLIITRDQSVTPQAIDEAVIQLFHLAEEVDAEYDGWEAQLISTKN